MRVDWQKTASVLFCVLVAIGTFFLIGKYVIAIVMPFLIAWGLALMIRPAANALSARTKLSRRVSSVLVLILVFAVIGILLFFGVNRLIEELGRLAEGFSSGDSAIGEQISRIVDSLDNVSSHIPFLADGDGGKLKESFDDMLISMLREAGTKLISSVTALATGLIRALPSITLFIVVTIIAAFYFALDLDAIHGTIASLLPPRLSQKLPEFRERTRRFVAKYLRAYLFLMFLTFCELFAGFTILSVDYSFLLALIISVVDILPVLGVGTVLVPWSVAELFMRDFKTGFGLLILWAVITVVRQIVEPKIVGGSLGLHPVITLVGMYVGFRLFGIVGMLAAPALAVAVKAALREWTPKMRQT